MLRSNENGWSDQKKGTDDELYRFACMNVDQFIVQYLTLLCNSPRKRQQKIYVNAFYSSTCIGFVVYVSQTAAEFNVKNRDFD